MSVAGRSGSLLAAARPYWRVVPKPVLAVGVGVAATFIVAAVALVGLTRELIVDNSARQIEETVSLLAEQTQQQFLAADIQLSDLQERLERAVASGASLRDYVSAPQFGESLRDAAVRLIDIDTLYVTDAEGRVIAASRSGPIAEIFVGDRNYFRTLRDNDSVALYLSRPEVSRFTGAHTVFLARRISGPGGRFAGVVVAAFSIDYFARYMASIFGGSDLKAALMRRDGEPVSSAPPLEGTIRQGSDEWRFFAQTLATSEGAVTTADGSFFGPEPSVVALRAVSGYPLVLYAAMPVRAVLNPVSRLTTWIVAASAVVVVLTAIVIVLSARHARMQQLVFDVKNSAAEERFSKAFRDSPTPQAIHSTDGRYVEANNAYCALVGYTREELAGRTIVALGILDSATRLRLIDILERNGGSCRDVPLRLTTKAGGHRDVMASAVSMTLAERPHRLWTLLDVTRQTQMEDQLRQSQKMEAVGQLTGGMAHDFNNLLAVIHGNVELVAESLGERDDLRVRLQRALRACQRGASVTRSLLAFARRESLVDRDFDPRPVITEIIELIRRTLPENITIELISEGSWWCRADPGQLQNAVVNLAVNSRDAMPDGGLLTIAIGDATLDAAYAAAQSELMPGDYVSIRVSDTGKGMPPDVVARVFEPFFTTKAFGRGSGLGLSMVYGFVKQSKGHITVTSEVGKGTTVTLYLARGGTERPAGVVPERNVPGRGETILVVEDDTDVRELAATYLRQTGYTVLEAADGQSGLDVLRQDTVALLLTDLIMPGRMGGRDLAAKAVALRPGLPVVFMSGYAEDGAPGDEGRPFVQKPFTREELNRAVRAALRSVPAA